MMSIFRLRVGAPVRSRGGRSDIKCEGIYIYR